MWLYHDIFVDIYHAVITWKHQDIYHDIYRVFVRTLISSHVKFSKISLLPLDCLQHYFFFFPCQAGMLHSLLNWLIHSNAIPGPYRTCLQICPCPTCSEPLEMNSVFHLASFESLSNQYSVLGKIIFKTIWNQNQNHGLKNDLKSKSKSPLPKRFQIKIIFQTISNQNHFQNRYLIQSRPMLGSHFIFRHTVVCTCMLSTSTVSQMHCHWACLNEK